MPELEWHRVGNTSEINEDEPLSVAIGKTRIGIYLVENQYYALEDVCPHADALLSEGFVEGCEVECPLHAATFDVTNGKLLGGPGGRDLQTYQIKIEGDSIMVQV